MQKNYDIVVVGAGPSGIMASLNCVKNNGKLKVAIVEKNNQIGKKLRITGGGRCNLTSNIDIELFKNYIPHNSKFMYKSFKSFSNIDLINLFKDGGIKFHSEGKKVYPLSNDSNEIINFLYRQIREYNIDLILNEELKDFYIDEKIVIKTSNEWINAKALILSTGGESFKSTGSDGYILKILAKKGISVNRSKPSLVKIDLLNYEKNLKGISLKDAVLSAFHNNKKVKELKGELIFTHLGISAPLAINMSSYIADKDLSLIDLELDMMPCLSISDIENILRKNDKKNIVNKLSEYLPKNLLKEIYSDSLEMDFNNLKKENLKNLIYRIKNKKLKVKELGKLETAIITRGGVSTKEISSSTMELKKMKNIFVCGEMIDVDALTGGYNLQISFSTGYVAGESASKLF